MCSRKWMTDFLMFDKLRLPVVVIVWITGADVWIFGDIVILANVHVFQRQGAARVCSLLPRRSVLSRTSS
ncbi:hypothetical protein K503DRAFT_330071 [Rhizopogon vinicolor AM-OR11-026]|uniref:Uncharacterized protein n=1 Tax=Rhizopogon vinicolor AM-OR11-026 TaxID=1314800 RepID=A0A1B7MTX8_9AGAM|nr:hypothetical protein K503DRAFT_330071 [Rhizopogon vinicolor AM-OR11-026]